MRFQDLEMAFDFVSSGQAYEHSAYVRRSTGEIFYRSEIAGLSELPDDWEAHEEDFLEIPHKNELDLGQGLVWRFVERQIPDHYSEVRSIFSRRGAYSRFKSLLQRLDLLDEWYELERQETRVALTNWCVENGLVPESDAL